MDTRSGLASHVAILPIVDPILAVVKALRDAGVAFIVVGGVAVVIRGIAGRAQDLADIEALQRLHPDG